MYSVSVIRTRTLQAQVNYFTVYNSDVAVYGSVQPHFLAREKEENMACFSLFLPALNRSAIPLAPRTIDLRLYTHDIKINGYSMSHGLYTCTCSIVLNIAYVMRDLDHALSNALQQLVTPEVIPKPEQQSVIVWLPTNQVWEVPLLLDAFVCFDSMSGKYVTGGSMAVVISPSSCSFLLMVDKE